MKQQHADYQVAPCPKMRRLGAIEGDRLDRLLATQAELKADLLAHPDPER